MVGHKLRAGGAVETDPQQFAVGKRRVQRLRVLPGQQRAHGLDGALHGNRHVAVQLGLRAVNTLQPGLDVDGVLAGFEQQHVGAALNQPGGLLVIIGGEFVKGQTTGHRDGSGSGPHRAGDESGPVGFTGRHVGGDLPGDCGALSVDAPGVFGQVVLAEHQGSRAKRIRFGDVGAGFKIVAVDFRDHVGPGDVQVFVATFVVGAAEVFRPQAPRLNLCSHRSVDDQNPTFQERFQCINPF